MESTSKPGLIQISTALYQALNDPRAFHLENRGELEVKGKGTMSTWWLSAKDDHRKVRILPGSAEDMEDEHGIVKSTPHASFSGQGNLKTTGGCPFSRRKTSVSYLADSDSSPSEGYESASPPPTSRVEPTRPVFLRSLAVMPTIFDVEVVRSSCAINLSFLPGETTLEEITLTAMPDSASAKR